MKKQRLIVTGNGMAGIRCIENILKINRDMFEIVVFGSEPHPNYNRILLSSVLQGEVSLDDITLNGREWYEKNGITLYTGETVEQINTEQQLITTDRKRSMTYDLFIAATGSSPYILPIPGANKEGVYGFRTIEDCQALISAAGRYQKAAVIGAGLLGLEAAVGLRQLGMDVSVIHHSSAIMQKQLDQTASRLLQKELERKGLVFLLDKHTASITGNSRAEGIFFKDGSSIDADLIVMAAGVRPNIRLAASAGLSVNRGIIVNQFMQTNKPNVYAVGECAEHNGIVYGLTAPLYEQGKVLAQHLCGIPCEGFQGFAQSAALKIAGIDVWSAGKVHEEEHTDSLILHDEHAGIYKKALFKDDKPVGVILFGDTRDKQRLLDSLIKQRDISIVKKQLMEPVQSHISFESMPPHETICQCSSVTKGSIEDAVNKYSLKTAGEVKDMTRASGSCGGCRPLVEDLLKYMASDDYTKPSRRPSFCGCTDLTEEEVISELRRRPFTDAAEVMKVIGWKTENGCPICIPALQYYLEMTRPGFIQFNGKPAEETCTLIPQMYGGLTSAEELKNIADIIEAYGIPDVSITDNHRLKLSGIRPNDFASIRKALKMPAFSPRHHWTIKNVRTCTCGQHRFFQELASQIEKDTDMLAVPAPISVSLSCENNCTDAYIQDIGAIHTQTCWEIYIGGVRRRHARAGSLFCVTDTEDSTAAMMKGLIQYYRETAHYAEAVYQWVDRLGLVHIREILFEEDVRTQLVKNLHSDISLLQNPSARKTPYERMMLFD